MVNMNCVRKYFIGHHHFKKSKFGLNKSFIFRPKIYINFICNEANLKQLFQYRKLMIMR